MNLLLDFPVTQCFDSLYPTAVGSRRLSRAPQWNDDGRSSFEPRISSRSLPMLLGPTCGARSLVLGLDCAHGLWMSSMQSQDRGQVLLFAHSRTSPKLPPPGAMTATRVRDPQTRDPISTFSAAVCNDIRTAPSSVAHGERDRRRPFSLTDGRSVARTRAGAHAHAPQGCGLFLCLPGVALLFGGTKM